MPTQQAAAEVSLTCQNNQTMGTPLTPSHPRNPGNPGGDDLGEDLGDDPFNDIDNSDNENNENNINEATTVLQALGHAIKNLACTTQCNEESGTSSGKMRVCKPDTFDGMDPKKLCTFLEINACYWEHKEEVQWANRHQTPAQNSSNKLSSSTPNSSHNKSALSSTTSSKSNNSNNKKLTNVSSSNPELHKLSKNGKLMVAECKRCYDLKLCMFCGGNGHFTDKCEKKAAKNKAKAHAAKATESPQEQSGSTPGSTPEAKKNR
ncbi:hypothetical protein ID866_10346 [Astraeus odoratus]|nr:hypothetical protein ID866_10346 [Astraeus odoratus]